MPYCSLCMGDIYVSSILQSYAALFDPLGMSKFNTLMVLQVSIDINENYE